MEEKQRVLAGYEPTALFEHFENISAIPRGSGNEAGIAAYLCAFARERGLEYRTDTLHNVLIQKPASPGFETRPPVILQGHTDMVCEKNADVEHDFLRDGLKLRVEDGWLSAEGTTLGGDDGAAVAIMLAVLEDEAAAHPALECVFTTQEETGMDGANGFDWSLVRGRTLINLDSETPGVATVSCAGGATGCVRFRAQPQPCADRALRVSVSGLAGGHSGADIHLGRANAVLTLCRILSETADRAPLRLVSLDGGSKANAIPRECAAVIAVEDAPAAEARIKEAARRMKKELSAADAGFCVRTEPVPAEQALSDGDTRRILSFASLVPNGVQTRTPDAPELVESSSSLGIVRTEDGETVFTVMPRSSADSRLDLLIRKIELLAGLLGARAEFFDRHPGWAFAPESRVRKVYLETYREQTGTEARVEAIHAGLECGVIGQKLGGLDAVSIGPDLRDIHTPDERMELRSFADTYALVKRMLEKL